MRRLCRDHPQDLELATTVRQTRDIVARGKIAVFMHTELLLIANDLAMLRSYHAMGLRVTGLVYDSLPDWIDGALEQRRPGGSTDFGRQVIRELNRLGMVIDVSHASRQAVLDILQESRQPIVASHSMAKRLAPLLRNLSDEEITGIAAGGGVIGVHFGSALCDVECLKRRTGDSGPRFGEQRPEMIGKVLVPGAIDPFQYEADLHSIRDAVSGAFFPRVGVDKLLEHVDYMVKIAGIDHVGIGSDLQYLDDVLIGLDTVADMPNLTTALLDHGYSPEAVYKILGGNFLRVMEQVIGQ